MGETTDSMSVQRVAQTPMICQVYTFQGANITTSELVGPDIAGHVDFFAYISSFFAYWRGSCKYSLNFYCSTFTTCRFRISVVYNAVALSDTNSGDVVSRIVDVKGDTTIEMTVPYLWQTLYRYTSDTQNYPRLKIEQITPIVGTSIATDPAIYLVIWRAAGEDIRYNQLVENQVSALDLDDSDLLEFEAQVDPRASFKKSFEPILDGSSFVVESGAVSGENITSIHDMVKRYVRLVQAQATNTYPRTGILTGPFHSLGDIYKYWRGSRRVKHYPTVQPATDPSFGYDINQTNIITMQNPSNSLRFGAGAALTKPHVWPMLEIEIPWYATVPFIPVDLTAATPIAPGDLPRTIVYSEGQEYIETATTLISGGDDFVYGFLIAPDI